MCSILYTPPPFAIYTTGIQAFLTFQKHLFTFTYPRESTILWVSFSSKPLTVKHFRKECEGKAITYSPLSYFRQLPHVVRCWPQPVAVCCRQGFYCAERSSLYGQRLRCSLVIRLAFHARESHLSGLLSDKWLTLREINVLFLLLFFDIHGTKITCSL